MKQKRTYLLLIIIFIIANIPIILNLNSFIYLGESEYSDIPISHYPNLLFIQNTIRDFYQIPLWSNLIFSGYPFVANPLSGLLYFPGWISLLFPLPIGINISLLLHLLLGSIGMFLFLRRLNISEFGSLFGSLAMFFSVKIYAHVSAGHLSLIYAIAWTPYLFLFATKFKQQNSNCLNYILTGLIWGLILLADLRWAIPSFLIWIFLLVEKNIDFKIYVKFIFLTLFIGLLTSIAQWLPFLQYVSLSTRKNLTTSDNLIFSLSLTDLLNLFFPFFEGNAETRMYPGAIILLLSILGIFLFKENKPSRKWYLLGFISILLALGENLPGMEIIFSLPGFSLTRVPTRFLFLLIISLSIISAMILDILWERQLVYSFKRSFFLFPVLIFIIFFSIGSLFFSNGLTINFIWSILVFSIAFILILISLKNQKYSDRIKTLMVVILLIDLFFVNYKSINFRPMKEVIYSNLNLMEKLSANPPYFRIYTPSYSIPQEQGSYWNINQINGIDPIQLEKYVDYFERLSNISIDGYSVTLPPFDSANPAIDNIDSCPNIDLLQELNTKYVVSSFELSNCNLGNFEFIDNQYVYEITAIDNYLRSYDCEDNKFSFRILKYTPNQIILNGNSCGGILEFSEINYPGWEVFINGQPGSFEANDIFRSVTLPEGSFEIKMLFRPELVYFALVVQIFSWLLLFIIIGYRNWFHGKQ